jgi:nucleoid DNA-binding protein
MADELTLSKNKIKQVLNVFIESVQQEVALGNKVSLIREIVNKRT